MPGVNALFCVSTAYAPIAVQPTLEPDYSFNSMDRVINVEGTPTSLKYPALAHSHEKVVNRKPGFHNHSAEHRAGLRVIIFSGITDSVAVQRTTAAPATAAASSAIRTLITH